MARILLVDDDIAEISAVKRMLARASLAPVLATNASDAQAALRQRPADLLLVGATCEGGEAIALTRRLEEDEATRGVPLIVLGTVADAPAHAVQLPRPIDPAALAEQVQLLLARRRPSPAPAAPPKSAATASPAAPGQPTGAAARTAFERRGPPIVLPEPLERRARPSDPVSARRAAAEALRVRAAELRRAPPPELAPAAAEAAAGLDALFELAPPAGVTGEWPPREATSSEAAAPAPAGLAGLAAPPPAEVALEPATVPGEDPAARWFEVPSVPPEAIAAGQVAAQAEGDPGAGWFEPSPGVEGPIAETPFDLPQEPQLTSAMFEEPAPPAAPPEAAPPVRPAAAGASSPPSPSGEPPRRMVDEIEERARAEEALAAEAGARRARQAEQRAEAEAQARVQAARLAEAEAARAREAEERARLEADARAEATRLAEQAAARAREAEAAAREEGDARRLLEAELSRLRVQLDASRDAHEAELKTAMERTAAEEQAVAELRLHEARQAREAAVAAASEAAQRAGAAEQARASEAMEALRVRAEEEAARRAEAEAALARLSEEASRLAAERAAEAASLAPPAGGSAPPTPAAGSAPASEPAPSLADLPPPDAAQEAARRRALSLRQRREASEAPTPPAWPTPFEPPLAPAEPPLPEPAAPEPAPAPPATPPAELRGGNLEDLPFPRLLALAAQARLGGRLDVAGDAARSLWFEDGRVAGAASNAPGERLEEVALRLGLLTREQHRQVAGAAASLASRRAALLLVDRGYLKPEELTGLVRRRTEEVVFGLFADAQARFRWVPDPVPADERVATDRPPLALAVEGVRRRWLAARADAVLGGPASILAPAAGAPPAGQLGLSAEERRLLALADGLRTLDEVLALSPLDALSTRQLLAAAVLTGALTVRVVHAGRTAAQVTAAIDLARVREKLDQVRRADYFTILGIGRVCTPHEVRQAADRLTAELAPERYQGAREEGLPARLEEIRRVVTEAREVLADDALRSEYLRGLPG